MKLVPFGKRKGQDSLATEASFLDNSISLDTVDDTAEVETEPSAELSDEIDKVQEVEKAISDVLGEATLDNLMIVLTAIGMTKISLSLAEDKSRLSVTGVINISGEEKIEKE